MNPENGRFLTTEPFPGLMHEPVTLHKYLYAGGNPASNVDPSGRFFGGIGGFSISIGIRGILAGIGTGIRFGILAIVRGTANLSRFMFGGRPVAIGGRSGLNWGFWRDLPKIWRAGKEYAIVRGRLYTRHAVRMTPRSFGTAAGGYAGRGVPSMVVEEVIMYGRITGRTIVNGYVRVKRTLGEVSVVTEGGRANADIVITVIRHSIR